MEIYSIRPCELERKFYNSVDELADEISNFIKSTHRAVTLATDFRWWAPCLVDPHIGHVVNISQGYNGGFLEEDLINSLRKKGINVTLFPGESWFYILREFSI